MKKFFMILFALLISIAFVSAGLAQAPEKTDADKPTAETATQDTEKSDKPAEAPKPKPPAGYYGEVTNVDIAGKTLTIKTRNDAVTFDIANAKFKGYKDGNEISIGDKATAKYTKDGIDVKRIAAAKKPKEKKEKPAVAKKAKRAVKKKEFKDIDADKDGKITIEEMTVIFVTVTPDMFKQFDKNGDGFLDEAEYNDAVKTMK